MKLSTLSPGLHAHATALLTDVSSALQRASAQAAVDLSEREEGIDVESVNDPAVIASVGNLQRFVDRVFRPEDPSANQVWKLDISGDPERN